MDVICNYFVVMKQIGSEKAIFVKWRKFPTTMGNWQSKIFSESMIQLGRIQCTQSVQPRPPPQLKKPAFEVIQEMFPEMVGSFINKKDDVNYIVGAMRGIDARLQKKWKLSPVTFIRKQPLRFMENKFLEKRFCFIFNFPTCSNECFLFLMLVFSSCF